MESAASPTPGRSRSIRPVVRRHGDITGIYGYSSRGVGVYGATGNQRSWAGLFWGPVAVLGDFTVFGTNKSAAVPHPDGSHRRLYTVESPESWFEDFGSARLTRGKATIKLDRDFAVLVRTERYHVFLTPEGDSNGLFVSRKSRNGFEVREQRGGKSSLRFSYRIVARRKDVPAPRLPKVEPPVLRKPSPLPRRPSLPKPPPARLERGDAGSAGRGEPEDHVHGEDEHRISEHHGRQLVHLTLRSGGMSAQGTTAPRGCRAGCSP
jgi:hypothetical protein